MTSKMYWRDRFPRPLSTSPSITPNELLEILLAHTYGYYVLPAEPYDEVYPNIYLGDSTTALCIHLLRRLGITHVLNAAWGRQRNLGLVNTSSSFYRNAQIEFMGIEALDMSAFPLYQHFYSATDFIESALKQSNGKILVHCGEGISRSSTLVIAYLMIKKGMNVSDAIRTLCQLNDELFKTQSTKNFDQPKIEQQQQQQPSPMELKPPLNDELKYTSSGSSRSPTPSSGLSTPNFGPSSSSRSPTPSTGFFMSPPPSYNRPSRSSTPNPTYTSVSDYANKYTDNNNVYYNYSNAIRPIENRILMQRRMDFRRAQSVERPNYVTRGSSYMNKISCKSPLSRSHYNLPNASTNHTSLMTTYLTNRPLPTLSR
ncbi:Dual specificity protein phosphatase 3 [Dermatophagoides farinae]|uniref:protein-serine/threonine phosphatase n=1 Tax=Dermatophagoides farinae TaxID=6954 RepID=A0A922LCL8_DERFA|nr:Dual specificity protein phosphatase 3 [Dermatophagoides farinae]